jgi:putative ABC transport system ATP-binding protein
MRPPDEVPLAELVRVTKRYPGRIDAPALRGATFQLFAGELVAVTGPSGSGKSTLLNLLGLLDEPSSGRCRVAGRDAAGLGERARARLRAVHIGFVFQAFHLVSHLDVVQNVALPLVYQGHPRRRRSAAATRALAAVGLAHRGSARPAELSGGEQQRVALARAVVHQPSIVLCDEPTGNLDRANSIVVIDQLRALTVPRGADEPGRPARGVVVVTHDDAVAGYADRVVRMEDGRVVTPG